MRDPAGRPVAHGIVVPHRTGQEVLQAVRAAVTEGLGRTGRLVTSAAAILMLSFLSMSTGPQTDLKILATGLGAGILIDAVIVRCLLVPALVALFGRANWWLPSGLARVLRIPAPQVAGVSGAPAEDELVLSSR